MSVCNPTYAEWWCWARENLPGLFTQGSRHPLFQKTSQQKWPSGWGR